jgi:hypothetical protein
MRIRDKWYKELWWTIRENLYEIVVIGSMIILVLAIAKSLAYYNSAEQKYLRCMEKEDSLRICVPIYRQDKYESKNK